MPNVLGVALGVALEALIVAGVYEAPQIVQERAYLGAQPGTVLAQSPASGASVEPQQATTLTIVRGVLPAMRTGGVIPVTVWT